MGTMTGKPVRVTAEWALWGKEEHDAGYRLLSCSEGALSADNFEHVLTRYSPGTLSSLPQLTVSWLSDKQDRDYLGIAIHERPEPGKHDVAGRDFVQTRYFCMPFSQLVTGFVSYSALLGRFQGCPLQHGDLRLIDAELAGECPEAPADPLAMRAAALLLTNKPVCILCAGDTGLAERVRFIDHVATFLPYGMRSRLSASTWVSSTFKGHHVRLFFASASRKPDDCQLIWNQPAAVGPNLTGFAEDYLKWLSHDTGDRVAELAALTAQSGFGSAAVSQALEQLLGARPDRRFFGLLPPRDRPQPTTQEIVPQRRQAGVFARRAPQLAGAVAPAASVPDQSIEEILTDCAGRIARGRAEFLGIDVGKLRSRLGRPMQAEERRRCQGIVRRHQLLRDDLPERVRADFYEVLVSLVFGPPITYESYGTILDCLAGQPARPHRPLAAVLIRLPTHSLAVRLLEWESLGEKYLKKTLHDKRLPPEELLAAATARLRPDHGGLVCDIVVDDLAERSGLFDRTEVCLALRRHGYLAPVLQRWFPQDPEWQLHRLCQLLDVAHGAPLNEDLVQAILVNPDFAPSHALFATTVMMAEESSVGSAAWMLAYGSVVGTRYSNSVQRNLLSILDTASGAPVPEMASRPRARLRRVRIRFRALAVAVLAVAVVFAVVYLVHYF